MNCYEYTELVYYKTSIKECGKRIGHVSISDLRNDNNLLIYPNPAHDHLTLNTISDGKYELYDILGQIIGYGDFENHIINLNCSTGIYVLKITQGNRIFSGKFIKSE